MIHFHISNQWDDAELTLKGVHFLVVERASDYKPRDLDSAVGSALNKLYSLWKSIFLLWTSISFLKLARLSWISEKILSEFLNPTIWYLSVQMMSQWASGKRDWCVYECRGVKSGLDFFFHLQHFYCNSAFLRRRAR